MLTKSQKKSVKRLRRKRVLSKRNYGTIKITFTDEYDSRPVSRMLRACGGLLIDNGAGVNHPELAASIVESLKTKAAEQLKEAGFVDMPPIWVDSIYEPGIAAARYPNLEPMDFTIPNPAEWSKTLRAITELQLSQMSERINPHLVTAEQIGFITGVKTLTQEQFAAAADLSIKE